MKTVFYSIIGILIYHVAVCGLVSFLMWDHLYFYMDYWNISGRLMYLIMAALVISASIDASKTKRDKQQ